jgi:hypothetical protein
MVGREPSENQAGGQSERKTMPKHHGLCVAVRVFGEDGEAADVLAVDEGLFRRDRLQSLSAYQGTERGRAVIEIIGHPWFGPCIGKRRLI